MNKTDKKKIIGIKNLLKCAIEELASAERADTPVEINRFINDAESLIADANNQMNDLEGEEE